MQRTIWLDAVFIAAGVTFICFLLSEALHVLLFA
jgi:hypothetical protein